MRMVRRITKENWKAESNEVKKAINEEYLKLIINTSKSFNEEALDLIISEEFNK